MTNKCLKHNETKRKGRDNKGNQIMICPECEKERRRKKFQLKLKGK